MNEDIIKQVQSISPIFQINEKEVDLILLQLGSFLSIINNKKVNQVKFLITIINNQTFRDCVFEITTYDNLQTLIETIIEKYPSICKSKIIYRSIKNNDKSKPNRKKHL